MEFLNWRSERTKIGSALSGALVSTLIGLAASNLGVVSCESPAYSIVLEFLLPLAVPLLLFRADLRRVIKSTGTLLLAFLIGSGRVCLWLSNLHFCLILKASYLKFYLALVSDIILQLLRSKSHNTNCREEKYWFFLVYLMTFG